VRRWKFPAALAALLFSAAASGSSVQLKIDPAKTRVGLSRVRLEITDARLDDTGLEATYRLRNLFIEPKSDTGAIDLTAHEPLDRLLGSGGTLMGHAHSAITGRKHVVHIRLRPDGTMRVDFQIGHRIMTFKTRYRSGPSSPDDAVTE
jgi:hypothetical protein